MKVSQIYSRFMTPRNLVEHMLRVTAVAEILLEHWTGQKIDREAIIQACLLHDIAKPITFDIAKQAKLGMAASDVSKLKDVQTYITKKYGTDEHPAAVKIATDVGCSPAAIHIVANTEWHFIPRLLATRDVNSLIVIYSDMRISPMGILPLRDRIDNLKARTNTSHYEEHIRSGTTLEEFIKNQVDFDVNSITDRQLEARFNNLLQLEI